MENLLNNDRMLAVQLGGVFMVIAALLTMRVSETKAESNQYNDSQVTES
jgi:hypothetical protein